MDLELLIDQSGDGVEEDLRVPGPPLVSAERAIVVELSEDERLPDEPYDGDPFEPAPDFPAGPISQAPHQPEAVPTSLSTQAARGKRKATPSAGRASAPKRQRARSTISTSSSRGGRATPVKSTRLQTKRFMELLRDCKADGLLNPQNLRQWEPVWERLISILEREHPTQQWTKSTLINKYNGEKKRYKRFITFLNFSGTTYNEETGLVEGSEENFLAIVARYKDAKWLRSTPLGDRDVYDDVFWRETALGEEIDALTPREASGSEDDSSGDEDEATLVQTTGRGRRWREDSGDPDQALETSSVSTFPGGAEIPLLASRRARQTADEVLGNSLTSIANSLEKVNGSDAVVLAVEDLQSRYGGKDGQPGLYSDEVVVSYLDKFEKAPMSAIVWNKLSEASKNAKMALWAREFGGG